MEIGINEINAEDAAEEKESPLKKIIIICIAIFLIFILVSYISISYGIGSIIAGLVESKLIKGNELPLRDGRKIVFSEEALNGLNGLYKRNKEIEFKACLNGEKEEGIYNINKIAYPKIYEQSYNRVVAEPCDNSLIDLHSHPEKHCTASEQDIKNFEALKKKNADALLVIMCGRNRLNVYG